jgi:hypothetical protein
MQLNEYNIKICCEISGMLLGIIDRFSTTQVGSVIRLGTAVAWHYNILLYE